MSTVRQRHQPIALADILLDQDTSNSGADIESPAYKPDRIHIQTDMTGARYHSAQASTCSGVTPTTLAYHQDMTPFTSVSSFNFPATADATLLTPVSGAGSPPLPGQHQLKGTMRNGYPPSSSSSQQPTPPNTSRGVAPFGFPSYDVATTSSPPMATQSHSSDYGSMNTPYLNQGANHHGQQTPKDDVPPPNQYLGHYSVSGVETETSFQDPYSGFTHIDTGYLARGSAEPMPPQLHQQHRILTSTAAHQAPILSNNPNPVHYRGNPTMTARPGEYPNTQDIFIGHPGQGTYPQQPPHQQHQQRQASASRRRAKKSTTPKRARTSTNASQATSRTITVTNSEDAEAEEPDTEDITLSDKCEEDLRFIFETRRQLIKSGMKGKGMWEEICLRYEDRYQTHLDKPALQMRHARAIQKYGIWPDKEIERLKEAYRHVDQRFHKLVLERLRELGGARCYNWTETLIETKLIDLGYEERDINEQTNTRKRKRAARKRKAFESRRSSQFGEPWAVTGLGLQHPFNTPSQATDDMEDYIPDYTSEQRDEYIESVLGRATPGQIISSPDEDAMDVTYEREGGRNMNGTPAQHQQSRGVARQAVEHLMLTGARM